MNLKVFNEILPLGKSFDIAQKVVQISNHKFYMFFIDGFIKDINLEYVHRDLFNFG